MNLIEITKGCESKQNEQTEQMKSLPDITDKWKQLAKEQVASLELVTEERDELQVRNQKVNEFIQKFQERTHKLKMEKQKLFFENHEMQDEIHRLTIELSEKQKGFFTERERLSDQISALDKEVYRLNAQKERLKEALDSQINYMWDEYEITLSEAAKLKDEDMNDLPGMKRQIAAIKDDIKKLGDVNVNAIEDYRALMERYSFLSNQHDDLVRAEETLQGIITDLDTAMRNQFHEKFAQISTEFDKVFKELFGGGQGTLELMEDEDVLEAGIRIIAQPPGKKLQNMMQLSGGEKSLTAIALLFAIQSLKPSPFCLLDEIEAALDDSNVRRFAQYLNRLTKDTQFIVISHRKGTMEAADILYGITMQEKGVSTLVSVNLIENDLDK